MIRLPLAMLLFSPAHAAEDSKSRLLRPAETPVVDIVVDAAHFTPIDIYRNGRDAVPVTWRGCKAADIMNRLKKNRPPTIKSEPKYRGSQHLYGSLNLGNRPNKRYDFALDVISPTQMEMYFDFDQSGRLDAHPPLKNMGHFKNNENGFATSIELPWEQLVQGSPFHGKFLVWFILNSFQWANTGFSHSSHSQLLGHADIGGVPYTVVLAESAENDNDADLSNDGLWLRRGNEKARHITFDEARDGVEVDGKRYRFNVHYSVSP